MKKIAKRVTLMLVFFLLAAVISSGSAAWSSDVIVLNAGHVLQADHAYNLAFLRVAEMVEERSGGSLRINVFPNSTLGNERDLIEGMQLGLVEMAVVSTGPLSGFSSAFLVLDLPFMFEDNESAHSVVDGPIGQGMLESLLANQLVGIAFWENGFRNVTATHPVRTPEDVRGMRIRTMEAAVHMATFNAMGAIATPMAWGEVYTALQQGTIDAQENPLANIYLGNIHEVNSYINMTRHFYAPAPVLISRVVFDRLSPEHQQIILDVVRENVSYQRNLIQEGEVRFRQALIDAGATIIDDIDMDLWRAASQSVYDQFIDTIGADLIRQVQEAAAGR